MIDTVVDNVITDVSGIGPVLRELEQSPVIAFDFETTGLDHKRDHAHGVALANLTNDWYIAGAALMGIMGGLREIFADPNKTIAAHNAKFDVHFLKPYNVRITNLVDTMVGQWLVNENQGLKLKGLARTKLGYTEFLPEFKDLQKEWKVKLGRRRMDQVSIFDIPNEVIGEYAAKDARLTYDLWVKTEGELKNEGMLDFFHEIEMPFTKMLGEMEEVGMRLDLAEVDVLLKEFSKIIEEARKEWVELVGDVNPNSNQQLQKLFYEDLGFKSTRSTDSGAPSVDVIAIQRINHKDKTGTAACLLKLRKYEKLVGTYLKSFLNKEFNGRLHCGLNHSGTVTGRISSSKPNLQNVPARGDLGARMRKLFIAAAGYDLVVIDYSQIELRLLAHFSQDPILLQVFLDDGDPHQLTADRIGVARYVGKTLNFSWVYGAGPGKLADTLEKEGYPRPKLSDTRAWLEGFSDAYPVMAAWKRSALRYARQQGGVTTIWGRKRRLPDLRSGNNKIRGGAERQAINTIIQGSAGDVMKYSMLEIGKACPWFGARTLNQVHDEIVWEAPIDVSAEFAAFARDKMESIESVFNLRVPIKADGGPGPNWKEAK